MAPLDWGLSHSSRCIPIIHHLIKYDFEVVISTNGRSYELLKSEFPELEIFSILKDIIYRILIVTIWR